MTARTLVLLRHAKATPPNGVRDAERPLTARGRNDAAAAGAWLARRGLRPDYVLCSPSIRTRETWHNVALTLGKEGDDAAAPEVSYAAQLYYGGSEEFVSLIRGLPDDIGTALVIGHNPTVSNVSDLLATTASSGAGGLRTCGLAVHRFDGPWTTLAPGTTDLTEHHTARA